MRPCLSYSPKSLVSHPPLNQPVTSSSPHFQLYVFSLPSVRTKNSYLTLYSDNSGKTCLSPNYKKGPLS